MHPVGVCDPREDEEEIGETVEILHSENRGLIGLELDEVRNSTLSSAADRADHMKIDRELRSTGENKALEGFKIIVVEIDEVFEALDLRFGNAQNGVRGFFFGNRCA